MQVQVLGTNCRECSAMEKNVRAAVAELNLDADVIVITDLMKMMEFNLLETPGLAVNGKVKAAGRLLDVAEIKAYLQEEL
ncbi:MAG: thioredoxin family protein [Bacillota bacterium]|nr:thioredoxin family protein [Bacillota bacterium]MDW7684050.1 thioredoxin family protein [Bacillota bacterium]